MITHNNLQILTFFWGGGGNYIPTSCGIENLFIWSQQKTLEKWETTRKFSWDARIYVCMYTYRAPLCIDYTRVPAINPNDNEYVPAPTYTCDRRLRVCAVSVERMRNYCQDPIRVPVTYVLHPRVRKVANESTANGIYRKVIINKRAAASRFMIRRRRELLDSCSSRINRRRSRSRWNAAP